MCGMLELSFMKSHKGEEKGWLWSTSVDPPKIQIEIGTTSRDHLQPSAQSSLFTHMARQISRIVRNCGRFCCMLYFCGNSN